MDNPPHTVLTGPPSCTRTRASAGIGRTGTFIAIDMLRQQAAALLEGRSGVPARFNILALLTSLRKQRDGMIQMPGQYVWLRRFFVEYNRAVFDTL